MERDHAQLKSLGCFGTIKESFKIVFSWKRIFTLITLTLILPLSFLYLAQILLSNLFSTNINSSNNQTYKIESPPSPSPSTSNNTQRQILPRLFDVACYNILFTLNLLSIVAVAYTIACIFAAKQTTLKTVISVVPRVWKRLRVTYSWIFAVLFVYILVGVGVLTLFAVLLTRNVIGYVVGSVLIVWILIVYLAGFLYICSVLQLASVVSVLEEKHGLEALKKSRNLIKGEMQRLAVGTFILYGFFFVGIMQFAKLVVLKCNLAIAIPVALLCFLLLSVVILFGHVVQTIVYFVCKSYHDEIIDKSSLSVNLEEYLGDYVGLNRSKDVQLGQSGV